MCVSSEETKHSSIDCTLQLFSIKKIKYFKYKDEYVWYLFVLFFISAFRFFLSFDRNSFSIFLNQREINWKAVMVEEINFEN